MREEVKRYLSDPDRGRARPQLFSDDSQEAIVEDRPSYIDLGRHEGVSEAEEEGQGEGYKRMVDVVLSDMSAPWEQTTGFWKRTLSDPYRRMMNVSGIPFRDHAGSMVRIGSSFVSRIYLPNFPTLKSNY